MIVFTPRTISVKFCYLLCVGDYSILKLMSNGEWLTRALELVSNSVINKRMTHLLWSMASTYQTSKSQRMTSAFFIPLVLQGHYGPQSQSSFLGLSRLLEINS